MRILENGQYLGETFRSFENSYFTLKNSLHNKSKSDFHIHKNSYLSILLSGSYIEATKNSSHRILPGDIVFRPAHYPHQNIFETDNIKCLNMEFKKEWFIEQEVGNPQIPYKTSQINNHPFLFQLIIDFHRCNKPDIAEDILLDFTNGLQIETSTSIRTPWLKKLTAILDNETDKLHSLQSLSDRVFVHSNYMARVFKIKKGVSIGQYQMERRLSLATRKLLSVNNTIASISLEYGFFDEAHFIRTFKCKYGITPHQFRLIVNS